VGDIFFYFIIGTARALIFAPPFTEGQVNKLQDGRAPPPPNRLQPGVNSAHGEVGGELFACTQVFFIGEVFFFLFDCLHFHAERRVHFIWSP